MRKRKKKKNKNKNKKKKRRTKRLGRHNTRAAAKGKAEAKKGARRK